MKKLEIQTNFTAGELSPRLYAHTDSAKYKDGLKTATNVNILPHGPTQRRNGSEFINATAYNNLQSRLIRFQFNQTNTYILEFGYGYIQFYKAGSVVLSGGVPYQVATTYLDTEVFAITYVQYGTTIYLCHPNHPPAQLVWSGDTSWLLTNIVFSPPATIESGLVTAYTITPAATTGNNINFTTSGAVFLASDVGRQILNTTGFGTASIVSITSTTVAVANIIQPFPSTSALAATSWKLDSSPVASVNSTGTSIGSTVTINAINPGVLGTFSPNCTITPSATTGSGVTFTAGAPAFIPAHVGYRLIDTVSGGDGIITAYSSSTVVTCTITVPWLTTGAIAATNWELVQPIDTFRATDVGNYIKLLNGVGVIVAVNSTSQILAVMEKSMTETGYTQEWSIETPTWSSTNGYPAVVAIYQQRLVFASILTKPQSVWMSASGIFTSLGVGADDSDAMELDITTNQANQVTWSLGLRGDLLFGTFGGENSINSAAGVLTPSTIQQITRSFNGGNLQQPVVIGYEGLYIQRSNRKIMSIRYNFLVDTYESEDLTFLAEHITAGVIKEFTYAQDPDRRIYAVLNDGTMVVGCYYKEQQVMGWSRYVTDGNYESVQVISTGAFNEVWVIVNRQILGQNARYVERFVTGDGTQPLDSFSDSSLSYYEPVTITGITNASPAVVTAPAHGFSNGDKVKILNMGTAAIPAQGSNAEIPATGLYEITYQTYYVASAATNTFALHDVNGNPIDTTLLSTYISGGTVNKLVTNISGLDSLDGQVVQVKTDFATSTNMTVSSGSIVLETPAYLVTVGLPFNMIVHTLSKEYNLGEGSEQGQQARFVRPIVRLYNSAFPTLNGEYKPARTPPNNMDAALPLFSGDLVFGGFTWQQNAEFDLELDLPFPCEICGIFGSLDGGMQ